MDNSIKIGSITNSTIEHIGHKWSAEGNLALISSSGLPTEAQNLLSQLVSATEECVTGVPGPAAAEVQRSVGEIVDSLSGADRDVERARKATAALAGLGVLASQLEPLVHLANSVMALF